VFSKKTEIQGKAMLWITSINENFSICTFDDHDNFKLKWYPTFFSNILHKCCITHQLSDCGKWMWENVFCRCTVSNKV